MEQKDLKKIKRRELLELMLEQAKRIQELELEVKDLKSELDSKRIKIKESGSIAEAALINSAPVIFIIIISSLQCVKNFLCYCCFYSSVSNV